MRPQIVLRYVGITLVLNALMMAVSSIFSAVDGDSALMPLLYSALVCACLGLFPLAFVPHATELRDKEGIAIVVLGWLLSCLAGALPYTLWGHGFTFSGAIFESVSGFTTSGGSVVSDVESLPRGILFWRASTHLLGGIGIVTFVLAILPFIGMAEMVLMRNEVSSMARENFRARSGKVIQILASVYFGLTAAEILALWACGMPLFDATAHSFATIATGGFSTRNSSIAAYDSVAIELIIIFFMIVSGMHFGLLFTAISRRRLSDLFSSSVIRLYLGCLLFATLVITAATLGQNYTSGVEALRYALFQAATIGTSTGFATADSAIWPSSAQLVLLLLTLMGACAGSTSGGIKVDRVLVSLKAFARQLRLLRHPRAVLPVRIDGFHLDESVVSRALLFIVAYCGVLVLSTFALACRGIDLITAFSAAAACMGNVGPGLGSVGSMANYGHLDALSQWVLSITMLLGRLEIFSLLLFFLPSRGRQIVSG